MDIITMSRARYRQIRRDIQIRRQAGSYVVLWPAGAEYPGYIRERVFSRAIGANAFQKARAFAKAKALELVEQGYDQ